MYIYYRLTQASPTNIPDGNGMISGSERNPKEILDKAIKEYKEKVIFIVKRYV